MTKAKQIRGYKEANPTHKPQDIAKACGVSAAYVYQVLSKPKKKMIVATKEATPTDGQQILRKEITRLNEEITKYKNLTTFQESRINYLNTKVKELKLHHSGLEYVISYLESRLGIESKDDGATV
jgi:predicted RNase H-like nuclease (RuvC/YqgF family)